MAKIARFMKQASGRSLLTRQVCFARVLSWHKADCARCRMTSAFDRNIGAVRSVRLGRSDISALSADIAQDERQIAPQNL